MRRTGWGVSASSRVFYAVLALLCLRATAVLAEEHLSIHHIDVGQGDSTLVVSPSGRTLLIDGGNRGQGTKAVLPLLHDLHIRSLNYIVATHYDADHIGGLAEVVAGIDEISDAAFDRGDDTDTATFRRYRKAIGDKHQVIKPEEALDLGPGVKVVCVAANGHVVPDDEPPAGLDENGSSVALLISYRDFQYFIGGDLTGGGRSGTRRTADIESLVAPRVGDVDVLHLNHHGSETSSNDAFLHGLSPEAVIISVGNGGSNRARYHHPRREVLDRVEELSSLKSVFQTERGETPGGLTAADRRLIHVAGGNVTLSTDGHTYTINGITSGTDEHN